MWFVFALLSAVFAALTSILAKVGIEGVNSNLATALRTLVVLAIKALWKYLHTREKQQQQNAPQRQSLAQTLRQHRQDRGMTQEFVAETLGVSRQAVSKWENGTADPTTANLFALARLYGVAPQDLLKE